MPLRLCLALLISLLTSCGLGDASHVRLGDYECDASEAAVRHLLPLLPPLAKDEVREFTLIKALDQRPVDTDFVKRFADLKLTFTYAEVLSEQEETHYPISPKSGVSPYLIQLRMVKHDAPTTYSVEIAWAHKRDFERHRYTVTQAAEKAPWRVTKAERLDGGTIPVVP
jgi:hypothetical protein